MPNLVEHVELLRCGGSPRVQSSAEQLALLLGDHRRVLDLKVHQQVAIRACSAGLGHALTRHPHTPLKNKTTKDEGEAGGRRSRRRRRRRKTGMRKRQRDLETKRKGDEREFNYSTTA